MRTESVFVPQSMSPMAWMMFLRACGLVVGGDRILEVEEDDVGRGVRRLLEHRGWLPGTASSLRFRRAGACSMVKKLMICP